MGIVPLRDGRWSVWPCALQAFFLTVGVSSAARAQTLVGRTAPVEISECDQVVETDAVLVQDLVCDAPEVRAGVWVGASNITVDLGGHLILGNGTGIGVYIEALDGVTVKNGTIDGFLSGIDVLYSTNVTVENVTIRNLENDHPSIALFGVRLLESSDVVVKDSFIEYFLAYHRTAVSLWASTVNVQNIEVLGGGVGVDFGPGVEGLPDFSGGSATDSRFFDVIDPFLIQSSAGLRAADNEMARYEIGISANPHDGCSVSGLEIEGNSIHDGYVGVELYATTGSSVSNNSVTRNWRGIAVRGGMQCPGPPPCDEYRYSSGNVISGNVALGNFTDLYHDELSTGNTWSLNTCRTKSGAEIPDCPRLRLRLFAEDP